MAHESPATFEPASPEYILEVLRDGHRQQCHYDDMADPRVFLDWQTTVREWREACDLLDWKPLGQGLNEIFRIECSKAEWKSVLKPESRRTLEDVCTWIAARAFQPRIQPAGFLGASCRSAGAFLTIRSLLGEAGADVEEIAPSTPLAEYARRHAEVFLGPISQLAPGSLPPVHIEAPAQTFWIHLFLMAYAGTGLLVGYLCSWPLLMVAAFLLLAGVLVSPLFMNRHVELTSVEFGGLRTFRDLSVAIADGSKAFRKA